MDEVDVKALIKQYLTDSLIMQLATSVEEQPWICNLHFVADDAGSLYWISKETSRHSVEITKNPKVGISIAVKLDKPLVGVQADGISSVATDDVILEKVMNMYINKHGSDKNFIDSIISGSSDHKVYVFHPKRFSLFDQVNFPNQPSQGWVI